MLSPYFINGEEAIILPKLSDVNPSTIEFEVYEERSFKFRLKGLEEGERIVIEFNLVEPATFVD